jgi:hypothetical protein
MDRQAAKAANAAWSFGHFTFEKGHMLYYCTKVQHTVTWL